MRDKDNFRMIGYDQQNEVLQQVKQLELVADSDSGLERSTGSSVQTVEESEDNKTSEKRCVFHFSSTDGAARLLYGNIST